ncbi:MAG TPA: hypothetical protein VFN13_03800 [Rudaea sp.]|nr:hypothetical protein [Rudaea sp.]
MNVKIIAAVFAALGMTTAIAAENYTGDAYAKDGGQLLYHESHFLFDADGMHQRVVLYLCPDGEAFGRKIIRDDGDPQAPDFAMLDARTDYREGVRRKDEQREVYVQRGSDQAEKSEAISVPADGVIDAGFDVYVRNHWDELAQGKTLQLPFLVPSKRAFYNFKLASVAAASTPQKLAVRLSLGAWYAFLAPSIDVVYDRATHRLLQFTGLSNIRDTDLKNYTVRIEFPQPAHSITQADVDNAKALKLAHSCKADAPTQK